jgi:hypothetical protein
MKLRREKKEKISRLVPVWNAYCSCGRRMRDFKRMAVVVSKAVYHLECPSCKALFELHNVHGQPHIIKEEESVENGNS